MIQAKKKIIYNAQYSMIELYLNDVVVKELTHRAIAIQDEQYPNHVLTETSLTKPRPYGTIIHPAMTSHYNH